MSNPENIESYHPTEDEEKFFEMESQVDSMKVYIAENDNDQADSRQRDIIEHFKSEIKRLNLEMMKLKLKIKDGESQ